MLLTALPQATRPAAAASGPALSVNVGADRHPISADIYGMNYPAPALAAELRMSVQRWGGNNTSRYNWQANIDNKGSDYYFENIPVSQSADAYIAQGLQSSTRSIVTMPAMGWVARADSPRSHPYACGFTSAGQDSYDYWDSRCGNGWRGGQKVTGNNPTDTSSAIGPAFVQSWVQHLKQTYAASGGVPYYAIDNEPGLWNETHRDVHPSPATFQELYTATVQYAAAIKAADPDAKVLGPVQDGWTRYIYAAYVDWQQANADRDANGGVDFVPWYLAKLRQYEQQHGQRLLDYLDLHYYPQASGVALSGAGDANTQALRLRTTRSLWDPSYKDESWINTTQTNGVAVQLIPRMRQWVAANYPGTKTAITEYNWGALDNINGALAQADVLGIFGRERVDLATLWSPPASSDPGAFAFRMFRNYDGKGGAFGDTGVRASSANQDKLAIYAAQRTRDGALTLVVINKTGGSLSSTISLAGFTPAASAKGYRYSAANLSKIVSLSSIAISGASISASFPAGSITTLVIPRLSTSNTPNYSVFLPALQR
jgi:hypothetical protein